MRRSRRMNTEWSKPTKYIVAIALVILGIYALHLSRPVIPLLVFAALIAVIVRPVIQWLHTALYLPRGAAVAVVYIGTLILVPLGLLLAVPALVNAVQYVLGLDYLSILQRGVEWLQSTLVAIRDSRFPILAIDAYVDESVDAILMELQQAASAPVLEPPPVETLLQSLGAALTTTFGFATDLVGAVISQVTLIIFTILASVYISLEAHTYRGAFLRSIPEAYRPEIATLLSRIVRIWNAYFRGQLTLMLAIGVVCWLGLTLLGVPGALYLGIIAGLLEIIPNIGPIFATIPAVIVALLQGSTYISISPLLLAGLVILLYVLVQQLENNVIVPRILGGAVGLPALVVMAGVLVGVTVAGILGALLATPVIASALEILRYAYRKIQGEDPFPEEEQEEEAEEPAARRATDISQRLRNWFQRRANLQKPPTRPASDAAPAPKSDTDE